MFKEMLRKPSSHKGGGFGVNDNNFKKFSKADQVTRLSENSKSKKTRELDELNKKIMSYIQR